MPALPIRLYVRDRSVTGDWRSVGYFDNQQQALDAYDKLAKDKSTIDVMLAQVLEERIP